MKKQQIRILLCDDDKYFRMAVKDLIHDHGIITEASNETEAFELLNNNFFNLALIDMDIDGPRSGLKILKLAKSQNIHSIILSSQNEEDIIEKAYEAGCDHFLTKIHYRSHLDPYIHNYKKNYLSDDLNKFFTNKYITQDSELIQEITKLCKINLKNKTVFITGETGVGKSLIGELLHQQTYDESKPFIHLNCAEVPENLIESELFGHTKGAFTGAESNKVGRLQQANGGTLFLDEIATMPMSMQQKLLKAIDQKSFYPVGSDKPVQSEFTLITATCEDLFEKIHNKQFRKDFFFRVSGINLDIKPLRDRVEDIPLLAKHFINKSPRRFIIKDDAITVFKTMPWPGNIRELKKKIEILSTTDKGIITAGDISNTQSFSVEDLLTNAQKNYIAKEGLRNFIKKVEEESIKEAMTRNHGKISKAIKELRISASAFYRIFDKLGSNA